MIPSVVITKVDGQTGVVRPAPDGILAIIAPAADGDDNKPAAHVRPDLALAQFGYGPLSEGGAYTMAVTNKPVVLIKGTASNPATASSITVADPGETPGTSVPTIGDATTILDDYDAVKITFLKGGTVGSPGAKYTYTLDGKSTSGVKALGTDNEIEIPNTGITVTLGAGTINDGTTYSFTAKGPRMSNSDLTDALEALRTYSGGWDAAVVMNLDADDDTVGAVDLWLSSMHSQGKYKTTVLNAVPRDQEDEDESDYQEAMTTAFEESASIDTLVCGDAAYVPSVLTGVRQTRPVAMVVAARGMAIDIATDAAFVADGPVKGASLSDDDGNAKYHDEALFPGLDDIRLTTLRTMNGREGVYVTNPNLISPSGSDYVYWQHARVMNRACEIAFQVLTGRLSQGVQKDAATGFILESAAQEIEGLVQAELDKQLLKPNRVSGVSFTLARNDDLSSNAGATLNGTLSISALAYAKKFNIKAGFVKSITVTV